jgi:hypothetical protein
MSCLLWEQTFYESGQSVVDRIKTLIPQVRTEFAAACAFHARTEMKLRHVPLLIVREMARSPAHKHVVADLLRDVIQRADELSEFVSIYWQEGKCPLSAQVKKGLAAAFRKFSEYDLAKYNRDKGVKLRDVLFLCHSKPVDGQGHNKHGRKALKDGLSPPYQLNEHEELYRKLVDGELATPDTWETQLSAGADKKLTFERLMVERKLGALAFLRNLRNMQQAGVSEAQILTYGAVCKVDRVLPFRFLAAARYAPTLEPMLEEMMFRCLDSGGSGEKLPGRTVVLVDVSGSMDQPLSEKSDMLRVDAAYGVAILARELCKDIAVYTFSGGLVQVPPRRGFALRDVMEQSQDHLSTHLREALEQINAHDNYDRIIVITDEQSSDGIVGSKAGTKAYCINVGTFKNGVGYGTQWTHIDGWSEAVLTYIKEIEKD